MKWTTQKKLLTTKQQANALRALMFLKEKRMGYIKGCMCANGRKQRSNSNKKSATSPTAVTKSLLITTAINATERRDVAMVDFLEAFLTANMDEEVILMLTGKIAEIMESISPKTYRDYVPIVTTGKNMLYV